ncbi:MULTISPECIES: lipid kinase [Brucella]|uniref:Lipid kinase n=2 Tax=Ochrobactrum TaxID=528 RepID=A0ABD5JVJ7_9HYPH|nr:MULTISPECIES: lipid kinase [Brucella]MDX4073008.1 lipid kinase [Brucella sp. NBRC 113783]RRD23561.1 lipid kinase [Brucellaceae bacterium VT-16-1752]SPL65218.1 Transcription regulator [contains diacylglycerol kinase catalytic domain] [[Ochrobactrum] soli]
MAKTTKRRALLIVNPNARNGKGFGGAMRTELERGGLELFEHQPREGETISDVISRERDHDLVVIGGGDGSLNAAAKGLMETRMPLAILPLGTANDFARTVGIPADPVEAARQIATYKVHPIDLGEVNGHLYFNVASIGFSAELAQQLSADAKKKWGKLGYGIVAARILMRSELFTAYLEHDGITEKIKTLQVSVGNGKFYGGGMAVEKDAAIDDGKLDFYSLEVDHWWHLLRLLPSLRRGTQSKWNDVRAFPTTEVIIRTKKPRAVNTDGELSTWTPAHFKLHRQAINALIPT